MQATSAIMMPPAHLSGCLFAAIIRDTRGVDLPDAARFNHFPASPLVSVTYVIEGALRLVPTGSTTEHARTAAPMPPLSVVAPQNAPVTSWSTGQVAVVTLGFYPEAWEKLRAHGVDADVTAALQNAYRDAQTPDDFANCWADCTAQITPIWQAARTTEGLADWAGSTFLADWTRSVMGRAAMAGPGRSIRALERRLRRWSRQSQQSLKFFADFENLHRLSQQRTDTSLANLAIDAGYADQSHMGRAVRRATGFSPAKLNRMVDTDEAFWCYRLLGERF